MANLPSKLGRVLMGSLFIYGGQNAMKHKAHLEPMIAAKAPKLGLDKLPATPGQLIQANGVGMIALGSTMALGMFPRLSALGLLGLLTPTTLAGHAFWEIEDPQQRNQQMTAFFGNLAVAGGLLNVIGSKN